MATKVIYKKGTKATYLSLETRNPDALYWCVDTRELFKGDDLYSDGVRIVDEYSGLPAFSEAADGILYFVAGTGCGYVLSRTRDSWLPVVYGTDNTTIGLTDGGLMEVRSVPIAKVSGLTDALDALRAVDTSTLNLIGGLTSRIEAVEAVTVDLDLSKYAQKREVRDIAELVDYEIDGLPYGCYATHYDTEIRVFCSDDTEWQLQSADGGDDANVYYMTFRAYAPEEAASFKFGDQGEVEDVMYTFDDPVASVDEWGRKYAVCRFALASYDEASGTWVYFGASSTSEKYVGWTYIVEWYTESGVLLGVNTIRINLSNESCHQSTEPYYVNEIKSALKAIEETSSWGEM